MLHRFSAFVLISIGLLIAVQGAEPIELTHPKSHQVVQRIGALPGKGFADVRIAGRLPKDIGLGKLECRIVEVGDEQTESSQSESSLEWTRVIPKMDQDSFQAAVRVPAGGWYRLECRIRESDEVLALGSVEPIGVGEVFLIAGQSYATNCNDERLTVADAQQRVVALNVAQQSWAVANDPQPVFDGSDGGSIWPPLGDALAKEFDVPVGFANVAIGGSASVQWLPDGTMYPRLVTAGGMLHSFRAVLWQQGESDVIAKNTTEGYVANILKIREAFAKTNPLNSPSSRQSDRIDSPPWLLAKSTHHPTVYNDPEGEQRIRSGIDELAAKHPGFILGPDTDALKGENRGDQNSRRHFSGTGQRRAAEMWLTSIRQQLLTVQGDAHPLIVGMAESDITPPVGFPMAGYYHERLAEETIDPLKAHMNNRIHAFARPNVDVRIACASAPARYCGNVNPNRLRLPARINSRR